MTQATYQLANPLPVAINARWAERLLLIIGLAGLDLAMVLTGFWLAYTIRFEIGFAWFYQPEVVPTDFYQNLVFLIAPAWIFVFRLFGLYDFKNLFGGTREYAKAFNASTFAMMLMILFIFFGETNIARAGLCSPGCWLAWELSWGVLFCDGLCRICGPMVVFSPPL
ncbi:MAG: hypothetical protein HC875_13590 [Anaerolineales bacterium]|nr:hypothetical protein [Anaerolineales bacterium]